MADLDQREGEGLPQYRERLFQMDVGSLSSGEMLIRSQRLLQAGDRIREEARRQESPAPLTPLGRAQLAFTRLTDDDHREFLAWAAEQGAGAK